MSPHAWTEDQLVEQPAIGLFGELGWQTVSALEEVLGDAPLPWPLCSAPNVPLSLGERGIFIGSSRNRVGELRKKIELSQRGNGCSPGGSKLR